mmetsp:Transcript_7183/g.22986  ORF Transcript_7183/g.22986 Transcript_7183/m.22986 type:complete len:408 (-) Transcript_7183:23-1246(-)
MNDSTLIIFINGILSTEGDSVTKLNLEIVKNIWEPQNGPKTDEADDELDQVERAVSESSGGGPHSAVFRCSSGRQTVAEAERHAAIAHFFNGTVHGSQTAAALRTTRVRASSAVASAGRSVYRHADGRRRSTKATVARAAVATVVGATALATGIMLSMTAMPVALTAAALSTNKTLQNGAFRLAPLLRESITAWLAERQAETGVPVRHLHFVTHSHGGSVLNALDALYSHTNTRPGVTMSADIFGTPTAPRLTFPFRSFRTTHDGIPLLWRVSQAFGPPGSVHYVLDAPTPFPRAHHFDIYAAAFQRFLIAQDEPVVLHPLSVSVEAPDLIWLGTGVPVSAADRRAWSSLVDKWPIGLEAAAAMPQRVCETARPAPPAAVDRPRMAAGRLIRPRKEVQKMGGTIVFD